VIRNGDRDPNVTCGDGEETDFVLIPDLPELLDEDKFAKRMIESVNVAGYDWNGDGLDGYKNLDLFHLTDID
jgi:aspartate/methionine/tyrosine aminotransferase